MGHLVLHSRACCSVNSAEEQQANRFATELLAPIAAIAPELPRVLSLLNLKPLKDKWGLSLGSLIMHLRDTGLIAGARAKDADHPTAFANQPRYRTHLGHDRAGLEGPRS